MVAPMAAKALVAIDNARARGHHAVCKLELSDRLLESLPDTVVAGEDGDVEVDGGGGDSAAGVHRENGEIEATRNLVCECLRVGRAKGGVASDRTPDEGVEVVLFEGEREEHANVGMIITFRQRLEDMIKGVEVTKLRIKLLVEPVPTEME